MTMMVRQINQMFRLPKVLFSKTCMANGKFQRKVLRTVHHREEQYLELVPSFMYHCVIHFPRMVLYRIWSSHSQKSGQVIFF